MDETELRDWFAGLAMQSLIAVTTNCADYTIEMLTEEAYDTADAMLEARKASQE